MLIFSPGVAQPQIFTVVFRCRTILDAIMLGSFIFAKVVLLKNKKKVRKASIVFFMILFFNNFNTSSSLLVITKLNKIQTCI